MLILAPFWPLIRGIVQALRARPVEVPFYDRVDSAEAAVEAVLARDASLVRSCERRFEGEPTFDGHEPGWVVFPPGSHHIPTVEGGTMLFLYFMPGGAVVWDPK